ncbi:MAG: tetratricopeptide repeat protein, partial [Ktedonobacteraceae bacterium]
GTLARSINLSPMEQEEVVLFLLRRIKAVGQEAGGEQLQQFAGHMPAEYAAASELVLAMDGLPLALDQAGAYIEETGCTLSDYLHHFAHYRAHLLERRGMAGDANPHSVTTAFLLAKEQAEREQEAVSDILCVCAFLHADAIPEELFAAGAFHLGSAIEAMAADPTGFDQVIASLRSWSLVQRSGSTHTLALHRLVQAVLQEHMDEQERIMWLKRVRTALNAIFPDGSRREWPLCERLLPHVLACIAPSTELADDQALAELLVKTADYLRERAQYDQAKALYQRALHVGEQVFGAEHPEVTRPLSGLAILAHGQGDYEQAEALLQRAVRVREQALGPDHLKVAPA